MVYSVLVAALVLSWLGVRLAARLTIASVDLPNQIFADEPFSVRVRIRNRWWMPLLGISIVNSRHEVVVGDLPPLASKEAFIQCVLKKRGLNDVTDLGLRVRFPFGLFVRTRQIPLRGVLVYPHVDRMPARRLLSEALAQEVAKPRKGTGDEFWGVRDYVQGDDARLISWKLTAKAGRFMITEYAEMVGDRVTVKVQGQPPGDATERRISEAASVARHFIDEGAEVRLVTDEGDTGFGRGLVQLEIILKHLATLGEGSRPQPSGDALPAAQSLPEIGTKGPLYVATMILAATVAASLWLVEGLDLTTKIAFAAAIPAGILADRTGLYPLPPGAWNVLNLAAVAAVLALDIPASGLLPGLTHLIAYAFINRMLNRKAARDSRVIFAVTLLMFVLVSWQTVKPLYVAAYVAYFAAAGLWLMIASERLKGVGVWRAASLLLTLVFIMAAAGAIFAATPRFSNPRFAQLMRQLGLADMVTPEFSIVSLHERMTLGNFDDVRTNGRRVMQVRVQGRKASALEPLRVRAGALDRFDGDTWERTAVQFIYRLGENLVTASGGTAQYNRGGELYFTSDYERDAGGQVEDYFIYPMDLGLVFSVGEPTAVEGGIVLPSFDATGTVYSASSYRGGGRYVIRSQSQDFRLYEMIEGYDAMLNELFLQLPEGTERIRNLALEVAGGYPDSWGKAVAIRHWLKQRFKYSYLGAHSRQSLEDFLFETRAANCEYFATAMAVMLRTIGVPSRLVVGYLTDEWDNVEGYYYVRNSDGHAWVEAYIPDRGWVAFDPTPATSEPPPLAFPLGREIYMYFLGLQMSWYRYVIGYDFYVQQNALSRVIARWRRFALALLALAALVAAALGARWAIGRAWLPRRRSTKASPSSQAYERALKRLAGKGFVRMRWQTPGEFARMVVGREPKLKVLIDFTEAYYAWRFGSSDGRLAMRLLDELGVSLAKYGEMSIGPKGR